MDEHFISSDIINEIKQIKYQLLQCLISLGFIILDSSLNSKSKHDNIYKITGSKVSATTSKFSLLKVSFKNAYHFTEFLLKSIGVF